MKNFKNYLVLLLFLLLLTTCTGNKTDNALPRSTPEAEGVSSAAIQAFIEAADKEANEIHSFMLLRHGKVISEGWWKPYAPELKHTMYSLSKSFTSTAVGFAVTEKLLTVNDKVISFFPENVPDTISTNLAQMTVKDLLTMSAGMDPDPTFRVRGATGSWEEIFFRTPVLNEPGSKFLYNSLATYMLSSIVQKVTGEKIIDYLTPRLFEPLGISGIDWEVNSQGVNTGGWGLRLKTEDIAKAGQFYLQKGKWHGKQLLPAEWIEEATSVKIYQAPDAPQSKKDSSDWMQGYCYQFWRCRHNAYRGDGAYGQYMIILPDLDAVLAITSQTGDMQKELNLVWKYLLPGFAEKKLHPNEEALSKLLKDL
jgi:CubicO group peptidase (beta-lactamase class C family)